MLKKTQKIAFVLAFVLAASATAFAGSPGDWTPGGGVAGGQFPLLLDAGTIDADSYFALGMNLVGESGMEWGWITDDAGVTMDLVGYNEVDLADPCQALILFNSFTHLAADFFDADNGVMVGSAFPEDCIEQYPFPACWGCMFQIGAAIWRSDQGGAADSWEMLDVAFPTGTTGISQVEAVNSTFGLAMGDPNLLMATYDAGATWEEVTPPLDVAVGGTTDVSFLTDDIGFASTGYQEIEEKSAAEARTPREYAQSVLARKSVLWRHELGLDTAKAPVIGEGLYKTEDGAQTWTPLMEAMNWYAYKISMGTEQHGAIITNEEYSAKALTTIRYTADGGATWNKAEIPDPIELGNGAYAISDLWMVDGDLGYAACDVSVIAFSAHTGGFLVTKDGGATWSLLKSFGDAGGYGGGFMAVDEDRAKGFAHAVGLGALRASYAGLANTAPTAEAGVGGDVYVGVPATLDGSGSTDPEEDTLSYKWVQTAGPSVTMDSAFGETNAFTPTAVGAITFTLTVGDGEFMDTDEVSFNVLEAPADDDTDDDADDDDADDDDDDDDDAGGDGGGDDDDDDNGGCCG